MRPEDILKCDCEQCQAALEPACCDDQPCGVCNVCEYEIELEEAGLAEAGFEYDRATGRAA